MRRAWTAAIVVGAAVAVAACGGSTMSTVTGPAAGTSAGPPPAHAPAAPSPAGLCHSVGGNPDRQCTPGVVGGPLKVCQQRTSTVRPPLAVTERLKRMQLGLQRPDAGVPVYDWQDRRLADYEEDHLVPLALGGAPTDPRNLWPEPNAPPGGGLTRSQKDDLEAWAFGQACRGAHPKATVAAMQALFTNGADIAAEYARIKPPHVVFGGG